MRKTSAVLATLSLAVLALTGCTAVPTFGGAVCDRAADAGGVTDSVTVEGDLGSAPDVEVFAPVHFKTTSFDDVIVGEGRPLVTNTQLMTAELSVYSGKTGEKLFGTSYDETNGSLSNIDSWASQSPGLAAVLLEALALLPLGHAERVADLCAGQALVVAPPRLPHHEGGGVQVGVGLGEREGDALVPPDGALVHDPLVGVGRALRRRGGLLPARLFLPCRRHAAAGPEAGDRPLRSRHARSAEPQAQPRAGPRPRNRS